MTATSVECNVEGKSACVPLRDIAQVTYQPGWVWGSVEIRSRCGSTTIRGLINNRAQDLVDALRSGVVVALRALLAPYGDDISEMWQSFAGFLRSPRYLAHADLRAWAMANRLRYLKAARAIEQCLQNRLHDHHPESDDLIERACSLGRALSADREILAGRNAEFVSRETKACEGFFETVESTPLTAEQRQASVVMEDRNLLVASAGSGKTSTVVGKVGYVLLRGLVDPSEILIVAFNAHAAREIEVRAHDRLGKWLTGRAPIKVRTFHALGLEIISLVEGRRPVVHGGDEDERAMPDLIEDLVAADARFAADWVALNALYPGEAADTTSFGSPEAWHAHLRDAGEHEHGRYGFRTLGGELASSEGARAIANWLYVNGISYTHEPPSTYRTRTGRRRTFVPACHIPEIGAYLVHHLLDAEGAPVPAYTTAYSDYLRWRRSLLRDKAAAVIDTQYSEWLSGELTTRLDRELEALGAVFDQPPTGQVLDRIRTIYPNQVEELSALIETFIKHARSSQMTADGLLAAADAQPSPGRARLFVRIVCSILDRYEAHLRERGAVDFEDMVLRAARYAREGRYRHGFRLILVDEFQDISRARADLLLGLLGHAPTCKLFAVGDDWQSIYRFAGSDISLFTGFESHFGTTAVNYLTRTFRSNRGIAEAAAVFVQQNDAQIRKEVVAADPAREAAVVVRRYRRRRDSGRYIEACLGELAQEAGAADEARTVYILGRYRRQAPKALAGWQASYAPGLTIDYKTIHGSKGLQADYVIVVGMDAGGFPSGRADDPLLRMVMPEPETHPYAEERRLFYVALTRARHRVYLLGSRRSPSRFLTELAEATPSAEVALRIADDLPEDRAGVSAAVCPRCGAGRLALRNGRHGAFYGCTEYPACRYTWRAEV